MARSSSSRVPWRYASISWPVPVVRSGGGGGGVTRLVGSLESVACVRACMYV